MRRYFYTEPLAAAWMAKHFGMKFCRYCNDSSDSPIYETLDEFEGYHDWPVGGWDKYYIHPFSAYLLVPQDRDLLQIIGGHYHDSVVMGTTIPNDMKAVWTGDADLQPTTFQGAHIIQRNGIAFMWPEVEDEKA